MILKRSGITTVSAGVVSPWWIALTGLFLVVFFVLPIVNNLLNTTELATLAKQRPISFYYHKLFTDPYYIRIVFDTVALVLGLQLSASSLDILLQCFWCVTPESGPVLLFFFLSLHC